MVQPPQSSLVFARDGSLIGEIGREWRTSVALRTLPKYVPWAFIAVEDHRFYQHDGVDVVGIAGAIKDNILGARRGASTITQQLVGNMHPTLVDRRDRSIARKLREQAAAREMERRYSKDQILEAYLNQINFGHGWYGIESAARHYFGKPAARLTLAEAATLAALPKGPAIYDPIRHPDRARGRRNLVLDLLARQGYVSPAIANAAKREPVVTVPDAGMSVPSPYFVDVVKRQAERADIPVASGGYRIYTTLDPILQRAAIDALRKGLARVESRPGYRHRRYAERAKGREDYLQGMAVALEARSGDVLALVGGRDYAASPFNRAVSATRQPGSAFKPVVYAAAVADSIPANEIVLDTAITLPLENGSLYQPKNADGRFLGPLTLRMALAKSRNPVAVQLGQRVGIDSVIALARRMGIRTPIGPYPASAIGASGLHPIDLVAAYTTFATPGAALEPNFIRRIEDRAGRTLFAQQPRAPHPVVDPRVAFIVRDMMRDVVDRGTATAVRQYVDVHIPVAGKTGTTDDNSDAWFVGLTPEVVAGVWMGFDMPKAIAASAAGGSLAAPIWAEMIGRYYTGRIAGSWDPPPGIVTAELDRDTGELADDFTPQDRRYVEYFVEGTEPPALRVNPWKVFTWGPITE